MDTNLLLHTHSPSLEGNKSSSIVSEAVGRALDWRLAASHTDWIGLV